MLTSVILFECHQLKHTQTDFENEFQNCIASAVDTILM